MLRLDYAGCGSSGGAFAEQTLESWRDDVLHLVDEVTQGPLILAGSSMGGWLMLLAALQRKQRIAGLVGIAAAPDFTGWGFGDEERAKLARGETLSEPSDYSDQPYITTAGFWRSGEANRLLGGKNRAGLPRAPDPWPGRSWTFHGLFPPSSPARSVQPMCRRFSSRTAITACRGKRI